MIRFATTNGLGSCRCLGIKTVIGGLTNRRLKEQIAQQEAVLEMLSHKVATYDSQLLRFEQERLDKGE